MTAPVIRRITNYVKAIDPRVAAFEVSLRMVEREGWDPEFFPTLYAAWDKDGEPITQDLAPSAKESIADIGYDLVHEHGRQLCGSFREEFEDAPNHRISLGTVRVEAVHRAEEEQAAS